MRATRRSRPYELVQTAQHLFDHQKVLFHLGPQVLLCHGFEHRVLSGSECVALRFDEGVPSETAGHHLRRAGFTMPFPQQHFSGALRHGRLDLPVRGAFVLHFSHRSCYVIIQYRPDE